MADSDSSPAPEHDPLDLLADLSREFAAGLKIERTLRTAVARITDYVEAEGGALFMLVDGDHALRCAASAGESRITGLTVASDYGIVGRTVQRNKGEIVRDVSADASFDGAVDAKTGHVTRSILCAPLSVRDQRLGAIELINKKGGDGLFSEQDLRLLETLAGSAALAILNQRMAAQLVEQERLKRELELAAEIQRSLLPAAPKGAYPVYGVNRAARTVSGDFYDFMDLPDGRIAFCLGDVSGKGMNAALLMAKTASLFRALGKAEPEPGRLLARINNEICETAARGMFVTMLAGIYDPVARTLCFANAGHEPPLLMGDNGAITYAAEAPPLGIMPIDAGAALPETAVGLGGGAFYVFTDGLTEAPVGKESGKVKMLGGDGVAGLLADNRSRPLAERLETVVTAAADKGGTLHDDITILAVDGTVDRPDGRA